MCFLLYAGTERRIPRKAFDQNEPGISASDLSGDETLTQPHFSKPEVQNIGSTSCCGCDFPYAMYQGGSWPEIDYCPHDDEGLESDRFNRQTLCELLESLGEGSIQLYGFRAGSLQKSPAVRQEITPNDLRKDAFYFKDHTFYTVRITAPNKE